MNRTAWYIDMASEDKDLEFEVVNNENGCFQNETIIYGSLDFFEKEEITKLERFIDKHTDDGIGDDILDGIIDYIFSDDAPRSDTDVFEFCLKEVICEMKKENFLAEEEYSSLDGKIEDNLG